MSKMLVKQLLLSSNYWVLNKEVVKLFGIEAAFLLSNFAEAEQILADKDGWFYQTSDTVEDMTTLTRHKQDQCIAKLEEYKILDKDIRGMPAKRYFKINYDRVSNLVVNSQQTRLSKSDKLDCKKTATSKELSNKELNHKESKDTYGISEIYKHWNSKDIIKHREMTSAMKSGIRARLRKYDIEEVKKSIDNYNEILTNEKYYYTHKFSLQDFMKPSNFVKFSDDAKPLDNYINERLIAKKQAVGGFDINDFDLDD